MNLPSIDSLKYKGHKSTLPEWIKDLEKLSKMGVFSSKTEKILKITTQALKKNDKKKVRELLNKYPNELSQFYHDLDYWIIYGKVEEKMDLIEKYLGKELNEAKLLTQADLKKIPKLYSQEHEKDPMVYVKFFNPYGAGTWLVTEFDGQDTFFGYVMGLGGDELGYFSLKELQSIRKFGGAGIERDRYFKPMRLSQAKSKN